MDVKLTKKDLLLLAKTLSERSLSEFALVRIEGPTLKVSFEDKNRRHSVITLFDENIGSIATIQSTETLLK